MLTQRSLNPADGLATADLRNPRKNFAFVHLSAGSLELPLAEEGMIQPALLTGSLPATSHKKPPVNTSYENFTRQVSLDKEVTFKVRKSFGSRSEVEKFLKKYFTSVG